MTRNDYDERHTTYARPGHYEREQEGTKIRYRYYLGDYAFLDRINDGGVLSEVIHYRHADPQNSLIATSSTNPGVDTQAYAYEAWGIPLYDDWNGWIRDWDDPLPTSQRGYTGQEHLQQSGLLHLNGRVYDPYTARFLSPDPELQDPADTQSYNRYSYVLNNPFKYVDPTGFHTMDQVDVKARRLSMDEYLRRGEFRDNPLGNLASNPLYNFQQQPELQGATGRFQALDEPDPAAGLIAGFAAVGEGGKVAAEIIEPTLLDAIFPGVKAAKVANALKFGARTSGPVFKTTKEAQKAAESMGYRRVNETVNGQAVFKKGNTYITRDADGHSGGAWKMADSVKDLASKETRTGTWNSDLSKRIGD